MEGWTLPKLDTTKLMYVLLCEITQHGGRDCKVGSTVDGVVGGWGDGWLDGEVSGWMRR